MFKNYFKELTRLCVFDDCDVKKIVANTLDAKQDAFFTSALQNKSAFGLAFGKNL